MHLPYTYTAVHFVESIHSLTLTVMTPLFPTFSIALESSCPTETSPLADIVATLRGWYGGVDRWKMGRFKWMVMMISDRHQ